MNVVQISPVIKENALKKQVVVGYHIHVPNEDVVFKKSRNTAFKYAHKKGSELCLRVFEVQIIKPALNPDKM